MYKEYDDEFDRFEEELEDNMDEFVCPLMRQGPFNQFVPPFGSGFQGPPTGAPFQGPASGPPSGPPPSFVPQQAEPSGVGVLAVDPGSIRRCTFRFVFIWPERGRGFWAFLVFVGRRSVSGWRWNGRRWVYFGMDLRRIRSFECY
ncbi:MAG: transporter [Clostridiales bacterium]|nr:transporter [Clostridiales bacterium]